MQRTILPTHTIHETINRWIEQIEENYLQEISSMTTSNEVDAYLNVAIEKKLSLEKMKQEAFDILKCRKCYDVEIDDYKFKLKYNSYNFTTTYTLESTPPLPLLEISNIICALQQQKKHLEKNIQNSNDLTLRILTHALTKISDKTSEQENKSESFNNASPWNAIEDAEYGVAWEALELKHSTEQKNHKLREQLREQTDLVQQLLSQNSQLKEKMKEIEENTNKQLDEKDVELANLKQSHIDLTQQLLSQNSQLTEKMKEMEANVNEQLKEKDAELALLKQPQEEKPLKQSRCYRWF